MTIIRYVKAIQAILDIEQKKSEISRLKRVVKDNLTVNEYTNDSWCINKTHLKLAFNKVTNGQVNISVDNKFSKTYDQPVIRKCSYVTSEIIYKDVSISLHSNVLFDPKKALEQLIKEHK